MQPSRQPVRAPLQPAAAGGPATPAPTPPPRAPLPLEVHLGLAAGVLAAALALLALPVVARVPLALHALNYALAGGVLALLHLARARRGEASEDGWIVALGSFLPVGFLARMATDQVGAALPPALRYTWLFDAAILALVVAVLALLPRRAGPLAAAGLGLSSGLFALVVAGVPSPLPGAATIWTATALAMLAGLAAQRLLALRMRGTRWAVLGSGPALLVAATQLLDGVVSYLSVRDPLGVLATPFAEQVAVSAFLLEHTGPGFVLAKWLLAMGIVMAVDGKPWPGRTEPGLRRAIYLVVATVGLGPGLFSATRLLG